MGTAEDETVGWHHRLDGHECEQARGVGGGQGGLACCSLCGHRELDVTVTEAKPSLRCLGVCGNPAPIIPLLYILEVDADVRLSDAS